MLPVFQFNVNSAWRSLKRWGSVSWNPSLTIVVWNDSRSCPGASAFGITFIFRICFWWPGESLRVGNVRLTLRWEENWAHQGRFFHNYPAEKDRFVVECAPPVGKKTTKGGFTSNQWQMTGQKSQPLVVVLYLSYILSCLQSHTFIAYKTYMEFMRCIGF